MAEAQKDQSHPHLLLVREDKSAERKKRKGFPGHPPNIGERNIFASQLENAADRIINEQQKRKQLLPGIQPHLVFRVPFAEGANIDQLVESLQKHTGLDIVSVEPDRAVIAFRDDIDLEDFRNACKIYSQGPKEGINPRTQKPFSSTSADFLEFIQPDQIRSWSRQDRIGNSLKEAIGDNGININHSNLYIVDLELWHPGGSEGAKRALDEVIQLIHSEQVEGERVLDTFLGQFIILVKVAIKGSKLDLLLELNVVAEIDFPPQPVFDPIEASRVTARDFIVPIHPPESGPRLCIIDSGITSNHPLLANSVGHEEAILTQASSPADTNGHGTMVAGLAVFGDVRSCYESGQFLSPITLFSARVLNDRNMFDDEKLIINQMHEAIETFRKPPYDCRIFNISLGSKVPAFEISRPRQSLWAEELDILARELNVLLIVAAGNHNQADGWVATDSEIALFSYPDILFNSQSSLCDPATAAIALTIGSLAQHDIPAKVSGTGSNDIIRPVARINEPSPFTRIGPGFNRAIKPELMHYGGNLVFKGFGNQNRQIIGNEPGTAVMSFSHQPTQQLFAYQSGTSFAAPQVARLAALTEDSLSADIGERPSPNLIRAVIASASNIPTASINRLSTYDNRNGPCRVCGYGLPSESDALRSHDNRVTMVYQGNILLDYFDVFVIPISDEFRYSRGERRIIISLAYDPPVRRRRQDYLGVEMDITLIRGKTLDEVFNAYRSVGPDEEPTSIINGKIELEPKANPRNTCYCRKNSTLQRCEKVWLRQERINSNYGDEYYLVIRCERKWAPIDIKSQSFGLAVTLSSDDKHLYDQVALRIRQRLQARVRTL
jgi:hypothetical protein